MKQLAESSRRHSDSAQFKYGLWDKDAIRGCLCDAPYTGFDCSETMCLSGDDPLTTGQVNEVQLFTCAASSGRLAFYFGDALTGDIPHDSSAAEVKAALERHPGIVNVAVTFNPPSSASVCQQASNVVTVEFTHNWGPDLPKLSPITAGLSAGALVTVIADGGSTPLYDNNGVPHFAVKSTKEDAACSNRGVCGPLPYSTAASGHCDCFAGFAASDGYGSPGNREDCGAELDSVNRACPGVVSCSGHGLCDDGADGDGATYTCNCYEGWTAGDCSERTCPSGPSWFGYPSADNTRDLSQVECSGAGSCDVTTGTCTCSEWATGSACEDMRCPSDCNGHGSCLTMADLAVRATVNGDNAGITYGVDTAAAATWDRDKVHGCICDAGWGGYDCSERSCSVGDDPGTWGQVNELQFVRCEAEAGTFSLTFRQQTTRDLSFNASAGEVQAALRELTTIDDIDVSFTAGAAKACYGGFDPCSVMKIQFKTEHGDVPDITGNGDALEDAMMGGTATCGLFTFANGAVVTPASCGSHSSVAGTTETDECSHRGLCDRATGTCRCFRGYGASNGVGGPGELPDCGYVVGSDRAAPPRRRLLRGGDLSLSCSPGMFWHSSTSRCVSCGVGTFSATGANSCTKCTPGTFQSFSGQTHCSPCPAGAYCGESGLPEVTGLCAPGTYSLAAAAMCTSCAAGSFQDLWGREACTSCSAGRFQPGQGTTACLPCPPGSYCPSPGLAAAATCARCTYSSRWNQTQCNDCPLGTCSTAGSTAEAFCYHPSPAPTPLPSSPFPSSSPTPAPTSAPTSRPTPAPTSVPTSQPTLVPTSRPTTMPTLIPTPQPTPVPTPPPTPAPTPQPTNAPSFQPTFSPTPFPTPSPSLMPVPQPTSQPTPVPIPVPTMVPKPAPTEAPIFEPTVVPIPSPTKAPTI